MGKWREPDLRKRPKTTHRFWCVALSRSARSVCAPGCHSVQYSAQEDPADSREKDHRVEVTGHLLQSVYSGLFSFSLHSVFSRLVSGSRFLLKFFFFFKLPVASRLTCVGRREDHSASYHSLRTPLLSVCSCSKLFLAPSTPVES